MEFNNPTTQDSICSEIDRTCGSTDVTYPLKAKTARVNQALDHFFSIALQFDKGWKFDDANQTDLPDAFRDLLPGQADYTFASELLTVNQVFLKNNDSSYIELMEDTTGEAWNPVSGVPSKFRVVGRSILFDKLPNYGRADGFHVVFSRNASKFISIDTTKVPGIPSLFHPWLTQYASLPYLIEHRLPQKNDIAALIFQGEQAIKIFMSNRNQAHKPRLVVVQGDNR